ncbi:universal stress protein [Nocardioides sp. T2.26MG-1]|uniref:universal stress protein n=1 Tax=Nocardioides sp. T2.26MG-1 TaxID=3041166 RepID=UPI0024777D15|nr:universal stress protein [Nocardioides sp. T2.26MG-1]CAI9407594.1 Universal stress protein [Nocardioides sp. T2.26MG-1]
MTTSVPAGSIVVGVDGSASASHAVAWAAAQAAAERRPLVLVHAGGTPAPAGTGWMEAAGVDRRRVCLLLKEDARALLSEAAEPIRGAHPDVEIHEVVRLGDPRETLLEASAEAGLLVVGTRGLGPLRHLLLGSVSTAMVKHATCPVVVVRPEAGTRGGGVLAGVAGEPADAAVLELAFRLADTRQLPLRVFHCFWDAVKIAEGARDVAPDEPGLEDEWRVLAEAIRPHAEAHPGVEVHPQLTRGMVDERLLRASHDASLVVLGHRRKPFLNELVYGSVAPVVVERAACTVAVVPLVG